MEEGEAVKRPLVVKDKHDNNNINIIHENLSPVTFVLVLSTIVVYCTSFALGNSIGYTSPAESGIVKEFDLTLAEYSTFVSIILIGSISGAALSGKFTDAIGRRRAIGISGLVCILGWFTIALSKGALWLDVGRFLVGFGQGISAYAAPIYMAEITPKNVRGSVMSVSSLLLTFGKASFFLIGPLVNWRTLALLGSVPYLLQLPGLLFIPESPRWLMKIGQAEESENALCLLRGEKAEISEEITDIKDFTECSNNLSGDGFSSLFQRKYARCLTIGVGLMALQQFGGIAGISFYTSSIFHSAGFSRSIGSVAVGTTQIVCVTMGVCFIDKSGRRPLLLISAAGMCLGCTLIGLSFLLQSLHLVEKITPILALAGVLVYYGFFSLGMEGIPVMIPSEIFPVNIKGAASSIVNVVCQASGWIVSYSFGFIFKWNSAGTFFMFAAVCCGSVLFVWKMVPETKGQSLEEIQATVTQQENS